MVFSLLSELGMGFVPVLKNIPSLYNGHFGSKLGGIEKMFFTLQRTFFRRLDGYQKLFLHFTTDKIFEIGGGMDRKNYPFTLQRTFQMRFVAWFCKNSQKVFIYERAFHITTDNSLPFGRVSKIISSLYNGENSRN